MITPARFGLAAVFLAAIFCGQPTNGASNTANNTPQDVFDGMRQSFRADKAKGVHARYQWNLSGPNGGQWWIEVNDGNFKMERGTISKPDVTFVASDKTWVALSNNTISGTWATLTGRLRVQGSRGLARKLGEIFP